MLREVLAAINIPEDRLSANIDGEVEARENPTEKTLFEVSTK